MEKGAGMAASISQRHLQAKLGKLDIRRLNPAMLRFTSACLGLLLCCQSVLADGAVTGTVVLDTQRPPDVPAGYRPLTVKPIQPEDPTPAIVWVEKKGMSYPKPATQKPVTISQRGYQFRPAVLAVQTGTPVVFPNQDDEFHHVFSYSKPHPFDLGRFRQGETPGARILEKPGLIKIYCEIHKHMRCRLLVLDSPWHAVTDAQGRFKITGIPAGDYEIKALLPSEKQITSAVTIRDGQTTTIQLSR